MQLTRKLSLVGRHAIQHANRTPRKARTRNRHEVLDEVAERLTEYQNEDGLDKLKDVVEQSQHVIAQAKGVFPFDLFPDSIIMDRQKVTLKHRRFFAVEQTISVQHKDIKNIQADIGPLFGSLTLTSDHFINNTQTIRFLWRKDVEEIQRLVQGIIVADKEEVELGDVGNDELVDLLKELGKGSAPKTPNKS
jgi:hypothetical protein